MILFICTGNTCRSPLAEAIARGKGLDACSAGLYAPEGAPASPEACLAAARRGLSLAGHRSRQVTEEMLAQAGAVYTMTLSHARQLAAHFPIYKDKIHCLSPQIPDPFGGDEEAYERCARMLEEALRFLL